MTAITTTPISAQTPQLHPLNIIRDLPAVADLVESCFINTMDTEGRYYIDQMRRAGKDNYFLRWAVNAVESISMPLSGYVWEENSEIVGNVSLIPFRREGKKYYLIANVAVRSDYQRRGIGRALIVTATHHARQRGANDIWLHVRDDNSWAIKLYHSLGFRERTRRTTWQAKPDRNASHDGLGIIVSTRSTNDWSQQESWLRRLYPNELAWYQALPWLSLSPGLWPAIYRLILNVEVRHWAAHKDGKLLAALTWQMNDGQSDRLWAAVPAVCNDRALTTLLLYARRMLTWRQIITLDFPAEQNIEAIIAAGFYPQRTLLWMQADETRI